MEGVSSVGVSVTVSKLSYVPTFSGQRSVRCEVSRSRDLIDLIDAVT